MSDPGQVNVDELSFEQALEELEEIVTALESGQVPLEEMLTRFERAMLLKQRCTTLLEAAEARILKLLDEQGTTEPFTAEAEDDKQAQSDTLA